MGNEVLVCPECFAEFLPDKVTECSDCHVPLVTPAVLPARLTDSKGLVEVGLATSPQEVKTAIAAIDEAGIDHHVQGWRQFRMGSEPIDIHAEYSFLLFVRPEDESTASSILLALGEYSELLTPEEAVTIAKTFPDGGQISHSMDIPSFDVPDLKLATLPASVVFRAWIVRGCSALCLILVVAVTTKASHLDGLNRYWAAATISALFSGLLLLWANAIEARARRNQNQSI